MTDRFKFRVWNKENNKYKDDLYYEAGDLQVACVNKIFEEYISDRCIIEQCTGLNDRNGKLIYEGDIIGGIYGGYISWCDECKSFELFVPEFECASCSGDILWREIVEDDGKLEVIGNIHENADLLEVGENDNKFI
jgi:hypothetical protein